MFKVTVQVLLLHETLVTKNSAAAPAPSVGIAGAESAPPQVGVLDSLGSCPLPPPGGHFSSLKKKEKKESSLLSQPCNLITLGCAR